MLGRAAQTTSFPVSEHERVDTVQRRSDGRFEVRTANSGFDAGSGFLRRVGDTQVQSNRIALPGSEAR